MRNRASTMGVSKKSLTYFNQTDVGAGTESSELTSTPSTEPKHLQTNETLGADSQTPRLEQATHTSYGKALNGRLDKHLLHRATDIIDSFDSSDRMAYEINLESLRGIVMQLWESATSSTAYHQEILAMLESAVISVDLLSEGQLSALREAISDLESSPLTHVHVDIIRDRFIEEDFSPLALLSEMEEDGDSN